MPTDSFLWYLVFQDPEVRGRDDKSPWHGMANTDAPEQPSQFRHTGLWWAGGGIQLPVSWIVTSKTQVHELPQACLQQPEARTQRQGGRACRGQGFPSCFRGIWKAAAEKRAQHSCCPKVSASSRGSLMELKSHKSATERRQWRQAWGRGGGHP